MQSERARIKEIDNKLYQIGKDLSLNLINPLNIEEEKKKFMKSQSYEPQFCYNKKINFESNISKIKNIKFYDAALDHIFRQKAIESYNFVKMVENIGKADFTKYSIRIFGQPDRKMVASAHQLASNYSKRIQDSPHTLKTEEAISVFNKVLKKLGLEWQVYSDDIVANAVVMPHEKKFIIKQSIPLSKLQVNRLIAHEIFGHILRAEFGSLQPYKIFFYGFAGYDATEEGLAIFKEKKAGYLDKKSLRGYAGRVLAIQLALHSSFRKTYLFLRGYYSKERAWNLAVRVKRGLEDTSKPGAFTKDLVYLKGYLQVKDFMKNNGSLSLLHYGKIGTQHVQFMPFIRGLINPETAKKIKFKNLEPILSKLLW